MNILALAGGVGGAKLAHGLENALDAPERELVVIVNTGDDFEHLGLAISPDLDTIMYTLSGRANPETGWGVAGETWHFMEALATLGGADWFRLGDRDLATHIERTRRLHAGENLSEVTADLCARLGVRARVAPMSDDPVRTMVDTDEGELPFQDYFVRRKCEPVVREFRFEGASAAQMSPDFEAALAAPDMLDAIIMCPSNPHLSIDPILAIPGARERLAACPAPLVAVSPIVGGRAIKGPAAKIMGELGFEPSALAVAERYRDFLSGFVIDETDAALAPEIEQRTGVPVLVAPAVMHTVEDRTRLARRVLVFARELPRGSQ